MRRELILTLDVDLTDYVNHSEFDELELTFERIKNLLMSYPLLKTTWFIRIDRQIESFYGDPLYIFDKHHKKIEWLKENGHAIGWHHHCYKKTDKVWSQEFDVLTNNNDIYHYGAIAREQGLVVSRMGWGYMNNDSMHILNKLGFKADSSAIPRPTYPWEHNSKDWNTTPRHPYFPDYNDYRIPGETKLRRNIMELPLSITELKVDSDTVNMSRYVNTAYDTNYFSQAIEQLNSTGPDVFIMHPYEILLDSKKHPLFCNGENCFEKNILLCSDKYINGLTMDTWVEKHVR